MNRRTWITSVGVISVTLALSGCSLTSNDLKPLPSQPKGGWAGQNNTSNTASAKSGQNKPANSKKTNQTTPVKHYAIPTDKALQTAFISDYRRVLKAESSTNMMTSKSILKQVATFEFYKVESAYMDSYTIGNGKRLQNAIMKMNSFEIVNKTSTSALLNVQFTQSASMVSIETGKVISPNSSETDSLLVQMVRTGSGWKIYQTTPGT